MVDGANSPGVKLSILINNMGDTSTADLDTAITFASNPGTCTVWSDMGTPSISTTGTVRTVTFTGLTLPGFQASSPPPAAFDVLVRVECSASVTGAVTVNVDADGTLAESDETNNTMSVTVPAAGPAVKALDPCPGFADCDGDGLLDGVEMAWGSNPTVADTDGDGRTDLEEMVGPTQFLTDPTKADTDGDTVAGRRA